MPDIDMESVGSRPSRSHDCGLEHRERVDKRLPQMATVGAADSCGFSKQRIRMSAIAELKAFAGREKKKNMPETGSVR